MWDVRSRRINTDADRSSEEEGQEEEEEETEESNEENGPWDSDDSYENGYDSAEDTHVAFTRRDGTICQIEKPKPGARFRRGD
ncbi:hypothetical protein KCU73_g16194, partial [Aureobasidium melanogenum]